MKLEPVSIDTSGEAVYLLLLGFDVCWGPHNAVPPSAAALNVYWLNSLGIKYYACTAALSGGYSGVYTVVRPIDD